MAGSGKAAKAPPPSLKKSSSSQTAKSQSSIANFFQKKTSHEPQLPINGFAKESTGKISSKASISTSSLTPAPSSDAPEYEQETGTERPEGKPLAIGLPSPVTPAGATIKHERSNGVGASKGFYSPSRKVEMSLPSSTESSADLCLPGQKGSELRRA